MKQFFYVLLLINLTAQAQGIKKDLQSFSDKTLLAKLISEQADNGLALNKNGYTDAQYQASFIGYAPAENPKYACMVIIKCHKNAANHYGASVAGPVFKAIIENLKD